MISIPHAGGSIIQLKARSNKELDTLVHRDTPKEAWEAALVQLIKDRLKT
jgi:hypothetical protein